MAELTASKASEIREGIRRYILENLLFGQEPASFSDEASLLDDGIIDSTGILELIEHLEAAFGIEIQDSETVPENLDSLTRATAFVCRKLGVELQTV
jgi:acyl carrier protein